MFEQFSPTNKSSWKAQIEKDLKGKPYEELIWQLNKELGFEPFYTREEMGQQAPLTNHSGNNWQIAEKISVEDYKVANSNALEGLLGGADALELAISRKPSATDITQLFDQVELSYISVHFRLKVDDISLMETVLQRFSELVTSRGYNPAEIRGSIRCRIADSTENWEKIRQLLYWSKTALPGFRPLVIDGEDFTQPADKLGNCLEQAVLAIDRLTDLGMSVKDVHDQIRFHLLIGKQYFVEIAKIRALKLLWLHVQQAYKITEMDLPPISAGCDARDYDSDQNTNMIRATTMALAAAIAGVDSLTVLPSDEKGETSFHRRIARNVQHLLKMESYIDRVADPSAGAFYIEKMTAEIAEQVWRKFGSQ